MADTRYWGVEFTKRFIELYKSSPCLWKVKCKDYNNKKMKSAAYAKLVQLCKEIHPDCDREVVIRKIQSLRGSFRKELKKVNDAKISGEEYKPSLWYFDQLMFTKIQDEYITESATETPIGNFETYFSKEETQDSNSTLEGTDEEDDFGKVSPSTKIKNLGVLISKKRQNQSKIVHLPQTQQISEFDAVGLIVSKKLQRMDGTQAIFAESIINKVLSNGLLNKLTDNSDICEGQCKYLYSRPPSSDFSAFSDDMTPIKSSKHVN